MGAFRRLWQAGLGGVLIAAAGLLAANDNVVITELHFHPDSISQAEEFVELANFGPASIDLSGWEFTEGIAFRFAPGTTIGPGESLVVVRDEKTFRSVFGTGINIAGQYTDVLSDEGETVTLRTAAGTVAESLRFGGPGWPASANGRGASLERRFDDSAGKPLSGWQASALKGGSPGAANSAGEFAPRAPHPAASPAPADAAVNVSGRNPAERPAVPAGFVTLDDARRVLASGQARPIVYYFHRPAARPCAEQAAILASPEFQSVPGRALFVWVDAEKDARLAKDMGVFRVPTFVFVTDKGSERAREPRVLTLEELRLRSQWIQ